MAKYISACLIEFTTPNLLSLRCKQISDMEDISNRALISRLYTSAEQQLETAVYDPENWSQWYDLVQSLTVPEKMVYVIVKLNQLVTSGGFANFYDTSFGIFSPEIIHVLIEIKAPKTAEIVSDTLPVVNPTGLLDIAYKAGF